MTLSKIGSKLVVIVAIGAVAAVPAMAHHSGHGDGSPSLKLSLAPSVPSDPSFHAVAPGGVPWVLDRGSVRIRHGRLDLRVRGLVIPPPDGTNTAGGVTTITASLYCGADTTTAAADTSDPAPLSQQGDARIRDNSFAMPATCLAAIVLVHPNGGAARYIAVSGWRP